MDRGPQEAGCPTIQGIQVELWRPNSRVGLSTDHLHDLGLWDTLECLVRGSLARGESSVHDQ